MGATVTVYWPGITRRQLDEAPGLSDDGHAWGNWMAEREGEPAVLRAIADLDGTPLLTAKTDGWDDDDVDWVTPQELRAAALQMARAVRENRPGVAQILAVYGRNTSGTVPVSEEFLTALGEIVALAIWAEGHGTDRMTLEVNF